MPDGGQIDFTAYIEAFRQFAELPRWVSAEKERWSRLAREARLTVN